MTILINSRKSSAAFRAIVDRLDRADVTDILFNWEDCELSEDGANIVQFVGRDREYSQGKYGGKVKVSKKDFLAWLLSEAPFDEKVYDASIRKDADWVKKIEAARTASGLYSPDSERSN